MAVDVGVSKVLLSFLAFKGKFEIREAFSAAGLQLLVSVLRYTEFGC